jgi:hypothetical protein
MASLVAMIDPGAGAGGGLVALCLFIVAPVALVAHLLARRFILVSLTISLAFGAILLGLWLYFDAGVPARRWLSFRLVWVGFIMALVVSSVAGIPALLVRVLRRSEKAG